MANYLIPARGRPKAASSSGSSSKPGLANSEHYRVMIYRRSDNDPIEFEGNLSGDFSIQSTSSWDSPLSFVNDIVDKVLAGAGAAAFASLREGISTVVNSSGIGKNIIGSAKTWAGGSELSFDLTVRIDAQEDTYAELIDPMKSMLKSGLPSVRGLGSLIPPGPTALSVFKGGFKTGSAYSPKEWAAALQEKFKNEAFHVRIGSVFHMFPCIVGNVTAQLSPTFEHETGNPMYIEFTIQVTSYLTTTTQDIDNWIRSKT